MPQGAFVVMVTGMVSEDMKNCVYQNLTCMMRLSRQNEGCLVYNIHQSVHNLCELMMYSEWINEIAFEQHNASLRVQEIISELAKLMFDATSPKTY